MNPDHSSPFLADGYQRAVDGYKQEMDAYQKEWKEVEAEVAAKYAKELASAGFFKRRKIMRKIHDEITRRMGEPPTAPPGDALYFQAAGKRSQP